MTTIRSNQHQSYKLDLSKDRFRESGHLLSAIWEIVETQQIEFLDLSYVKEGLGDVVLPARQLRSLRYLYLYRSGITSIRMEGDLPNLQVLHLGENRLTAFRLPRGFARLVHLRLDDNQLKRFDFEDFEGLHSLESLHLKGNKVQKDLQVVLEENDNCLRDYRSYYEDSKNTGSGHNNELKVVLIGNGSVGKTQIAKWLEDPKAYEYCETHESTHAIELRQRTLELEDIYTEDESEVESSLVLNIWDFGGQDIYHATHRMFLQTYALFLLVWDSENEGRDSHPYKGREYKNEKLRYWLEYATCFGGDSPILVIQNKIDDEQHFREMENARKNLLRKDYPNIRQFLKVSVKMEERMHRLEDEIRELYENDPDLLREFKENKLPNGWLKVRDRIRVEQKKGEEGEKTIDLETFQAWCVDARVGNSWKTVLTFLHNTGVLFHREPYFSGKIILNQAWAILAVYKVFDKDNRRIFDALEEKKGRLDYLLMRRIWHRSEYNDAERELFLSFMLSCELCFETTPKDKDGHRDGVAFKKRTFVLPQFLPAKMEDVYRTELITQMSLNELEVIRYRFLPSVFMQRFIVQMQDLSPVDGERYQQDVFLEYARSYALISADFEAHTLSIRYQKSAAVNWVQLVEQEMERITKEAMVGAKKRQVQEGNDFVDYTEAMLRGAKGRYVHQVAGRKQLLPPMASEPIDIFVIASLHDSVYLTELRSQLGVLERQGLLKTWHETEIRVSKNRASEIVEKMAKANAVIVLASSELLSEENIKKHQLLPAIEAARKGQKRLIPILVRDFLWKETEFGALQVLPKNEIPIGRIDDAAKRAKVWSEVAIEIRALLLGNGFRNI